MIIWINICLIINNYFEPLVFTFKCPVTIELDCFLNIVPIGRSPLLSWFPLISHLSLSSSSLWSCNRTRRNIARTQALSVLSSSVCTPVSPSHHNIVPLPLASLECTVSAFATLTLTQLHVIFWPHFLSPLRQVANWRNTGKGNLMWKIKVQVFYRLDIFDIDLR